jgi:hypothetical protein
VSRGSVKLRADLSRWVGAAPSLAPCCSTSSSHRDVVLHFDHLNDSFQNHGFSRLAGIEGVFGRSYGADGAKEKLVFFLECLAL